MFGFKNRVIAPLAVACMVLVGGCTATYQNHGYAPSDTELAELVVGVDSRATVDDVIGPPSASGMLAAGDYYYVRSRIREFGMSRPQEIERQVLAISFAQDDTIANIERFSLADGQIVPLSRRVTDSSVVSNGFIRQMLGNIGNFTAGNLFK